MKKFIIQKNGNNIFYLDENKNNYQLFGNEIVSMNMFAFSEYIFMQCENHFNEFIRKNSKDEEKEFFLLGSNDAEELSS